MSDPVTGWRKSRACDGGFCVEAASWRKASLSMHNGNCVEAGSFRKAMASIHNGACAEVGHGSGVVAVRDSADRGGLVLAFPAAAWAAFTARLGAARPERGA